MVNLNDAANATGLPPAGMPPVVPPPAGAAPAKAGKKEAAKKPKKPKDFAAKVKKAHKGVFYANDFEYLCDPEFCGPYYFGDPLKNLAFGKLDIGGEFRMRYHREKGIRGLGLTGRDDNFWLHRTRLYADYDLSSNVRLYGEYLYADSGGEFFNNRPIEENRNEIQNLFVDFKLPVGDSQKVNVRLGRQELLLGAQRLVSPLDWANTRRSFQGGRITWKSDKVTLDGFLVNPLVRNAANENRIDDANPDVTFYGAYATIKQKDAPLLDLYLLGLENRALGFDNQTIGSRMVGKAQNILYEFEGGFQFGTDSDNSGHRAGFVTCGLGKSLDFFCTQPKLWFWYDWASGGDGDFVARGDDSFDHLFPLAHKYNGFTDLFGRRNLNDFNIQYIQPFLDPRWKFVCWYHYLFLHKKTTPYGVTLAPFNTTANAVDRELGHEIDFLLSYQFNPRNRWTLGYSQFFSGNYYNLTPGVPTNGDGSLFFAEFQTRF